MLAKTLATAAALVALFLAAQASAEPMNGSPIPADQPPPIEKKHCPPGAKQKMADLRKAIAKANKDPKTYDSDDDTIKNLNAQLEELKSQCYN
jgi:hypothetical protein